MTDQPTGRMKNQRVLVAGLFHETNGFLEGHTALKDFEILRGEELLGVAGDVSPLAGVLEVADECHWEVLPGIDMRAVPGPIVEDQVLEVFWNEFKLMANLPVSQQIDGILLVLHGAMMTESFPDV